VYEEAIDKALSFFNGNYSCSQAVLRSVLEERNVFFDEAPAISSAFGGGIAGRGGICGAVSGAIMAIGVLAVQTSDDFLEQKQAARDITNEFIKQFEARYKTINCNELIGIKGNDPEEKQRARDAGIYRERCPIFVSDAVRIVLDLFPEKEG